MREPKNELNEKSSANDHPKTETGSTNLEKTIEQPPRLIKPEEKPFQEFINDELLPKLRKSLIDNGCPPIELVLKPGEMPVVGGTCWMVFGEFEQRRCFWLCFASEDIASSKTFCLAEAGALPSLLESFLIDERKTTLALLLSRIFQRLNGQKWLGSN